MNKQFYQEVASILLLKPIVAYRNPSCIECRENIYKENQTLLQKSEFILGIACNALWEFIRTKQHKRLLYGICSFNPTYKDIAFNNEKDVNADNIQVSLESLISIERNVIGAQEPGNTDFIRDQFMMTNPEAHTFQDEEALSRMNMTDFVEAISLRHYGNFINSKKDFYGNTWERKVLTLEELKTLNKIDTVVEKARCNNVDACRLDMLHQSPIIKELEADNMISRLSGGRTFFVTKKFDNSEFGAFKQKHPRYKDISLKSLFRTGSIVKKSGHPYTDYKSFENTIYIKTKKKKSS